MPQNNQRRLPELSNAQHYTTEQHSINKKSISYFAYSVINILNQHGFSAFLVGGAVRDLLLGNTPKDFDVATNATPEEVRKVFKNSRIIGRRFRIIHVFQGKDVIEVTTFRGDGDTAQNNKSKDGILLRDNTYGSIAEDAERRDFTINALYFDIHSFTIYDFHSGYTDLQQGLLRIIGNPRQRYTEDPVRMLRAIRFEAKLGFNLEQETLDAIAFCAHLLSQVSKARLFDESIKLFCNGYGATTFTLLQKYQLLSYLVSDLHIITESSTFYKLTLAAIQNSDERVQQGKTISSAYIYAALFWPHLQHYLRQTEITDAFAAIDGCAKVIFARQRQVTDITKWIQSAMIDIWKLQHQMQQLYRKKAATELIKHKRFRAAYDFLLLRAQFDDSIVELSQWWQKTIDISTELSLEPKQLYQRAVQQKQKH